MKRLISLVVVGVAILVITACNAGAAFAQAWEVFISSHSFVVNGEAVDARALNINGRNYISVVDFAELFGIDVYFDDLNETVYLDSAPSQGRPDDTAAMTRGPINWNVDLSQIYDAEVFDGSEIDRDWVERFRLDGTLTTHQGHFNDGIIFQGIILSGSRVVILTNNQYIILEDRETINRVTAYMNFNFDETALLLIGDDLQWEWFEAYLPFLSDETIERAVEIYNSNRPASQHRYAGDYISC